MPIANQSGLTKLTLLADRRIRQSQPLVCGHKDKITSPTLLSEKK